VIYNPSWCYVTICLERCAWKISEAQKTGQTKADNPMPGFQKCSTTYSKRDDKGGHGVKVRMLPQKMGPEECWNIDLTFHSKNSSKLFFDIKSKSKSAAWKRPTQEIGNASKSRCVCLVSMFAWSKTSRSVFSDPKHRPETMTHDYG